jgi:hypothetical protein
MKKCLLLLGFVLALFVTETKATHIMGSDITYECLGENKYKIILKLYRDCTGINLGGITGTISSGGNTTSFSPTKKGIRDLTPTCAKSISACKDRQSGLGIGVEEHTFEATIDLSKAPYSTWIANGACEFSFSWSQCCRNGEITTINNGTFYSEAMLNVCNIKKTNVLCNTSPEFKGIPIVFACCNNPFRYNYQVSETSDYDSLSYELVEPLSNKGTNMTYKSPFSDSVPMTPKCVPSNTVNCTPVPNANPPLGFYFNKKNGDMVFTPVICDQVGVVVVEIKEWRLDTLGKYVHIGTIRSDIQIIVMNCGSNWPPEIQSNKYDYTVCEGDQIKITIDGKDKPHFADPNGRKDTVTLSWDSTITQAKFTITNPSAREKKGEFVWQTKVGDAKNKPYQFGVIARDDACPLNAMTIKAFTIKVLPRANATRHYNKLCGTKDLEIDLSFDKDFAFPGSYSWNLLDSNTKLINTSVSKKDTFKNLSNGKYFTLFTVNNKYNCSSSFFDTIDYKYATKSKSLILNLGADKTITDKQTVNLDAGTSFKSYLWNTNAVTSSIIVKGQAMGAGNHEFWVHAKDSNGCRYVDSIKVIVTSTIGINDWNKENVILYPIPTNDFLTIELPLSLAEGKIEILNSIGQFVYVQDIPVNENKLKIAVNTLSKGIYFLKVKDGNKVYNARFVKE